MRPFADAALFWVGLFGLACFIVLLGTGIVNYLMELFGEWVKEKWIERKRGKR